MFYNSQDFLEKLNPKKNPIDFKDSQNFGINCEPGKPGYKDNSKITRGCCCSNVSQKITLVCWKSRNLDLHITLPW